MVLSGGVTAFVGGTDEGLCGAGKLVSART